MNCKQDFIAVFDSGVGGISVLRHLVKLLPGERFLYFGDSAKAPYGTRSRQEVKALTFAAAQKLIDRGVKALVVACNTATSACIEDLRAAYPELIIVGIEPALKVAADLCPNGLIGMMATPMTISDGRFSRTLAAYRQDYRIAAIPAPGLVELVEAGKGNSPQSEVLLRQLLGPYVGKLDALVLGCTHYPFACRAIQAVLGDVPQLDGGEGTAREAKRRLTEAGLLQEGPGEVVIENSSPDPRLPEISRELLNL